MQYTVMSYEDMTLEEDLFSGTREECEAFIDHMRPAPGLYSTWDKTTDDPFPGVTRWGTYLGDILLVPPHQVEACLKFLKDLESQEKGDDDDED